MVPKAASGAAARHQGRTQGHPRHRGEPPRRLNWRAWREVSHTERAQWKAARDFVFTQARSSVFTQA